MKTSRFTDSQIIGVLKQADWRPSSGFVPRARHQLGHVLQVAKQVRRHGRLDGVPAQGAAGREPAPEEDVCRGAAQRRSVEGSPLKW